MSADNTPERAEDIAPTTGSAPMPSSPGPARGAPFRRAGHQRRAGLARPSSTDSEADTIRAFKTGGLRLHNKRTLIDISSSAAMRAGNLNAAAPTNLPGDTMLFAAGSRKEPKPDDRRPDRHP